MSSQPNMMDAKMKRRLNEDKLGADIVDECRVQLMLKFRFLDRALWRMELEPVRAGANYPLATDAKRVMYDPPRVIARFQESFEESVRDYLHLVMHCIFRHPFNKEHDNREAWNLACDIIVENAVMEMCGGRFESADDAERRQALSEIRMLVGTLLPGKVYSLVKAMVLTPDGQQYRGMGRSTLNAWHDLFERDEHAAWPAMSTPSDSSDGADGDRTEEVVEDDENPEAELDPIRSEMAGQDESESAGGNAREQEARAQADAGARADETPDEKLDERGEDGLSDADQEADASESAEAEGESRADQDAGADPESRASERPDSAEDDFEREQREWTDVAKQIEMNLETFSKEWGEEAGSLMANLAFANRKTYGYTDFLRQFMVVAEEMQLNMDEFDYVYYTYGMDLYGNMPLVEPLEYKETERVHDFAIVIDTSESVSGDMVRRFIGHTFDILKSSEDYAREVNIHIIQCDARVQCDTKITNLRDVDKLMASFTVRGFGGTDFRPAFDYVDMLRRRGELANMKGLIYFTDGLGQFPEKPPDYDAAFVFMDEEGRELPPVPPWACKLVIDEAAVERLRLP